MSDAKLKSLADRIERLMDERDGIQSDIRDIYTEAKSAGYVPKVLRKAITRKRMDVSKRDEEDAILDLYEGALDAKTRAVRAEIAKGSTFDAAAEKTGVPRRTVARIAETVPENKKSGTGTNSQTQEVQPAGTASGDGGCNDRPAPPPATNADILADIGNIPPHLDRRASA